MLKDFGNCLGSFITYYSINLPNANCGNLSPQKRGLWKIKMK